MEENNHNGWIIGILIIALIWALFFHKDKYEDQTAEEWFNEYNQSETNLESYKTALEEANSNIEEANSNIENAKSCSWGCSYDDMQNKLENLNTVDTVDEP